MSLNGQRQAKGKSSKDEIRELKIALSNAEMGTRVSQMMLKQVLEQFQGLRRDMDNTMGIINDIQYRTIAMLDVGGIDKNALETKAEELKLVDYNRASDQEDINKGYELDSDGIINEKSVVIITSTTDGNNDKGIFRSKFNMSECSTESLRNKFLGSKVGDIFSEEINGENHTITVLGLRKTTIGENIGEENKGN
jgi:hypothetical protein